MSREDLFSVEYKCISKKENEKQETIIDEKNNNKLSPISLTILDSVLSKKITIIFSQGPLNLSPIISCLFAYQTQSDVLIAVPKKRFEETFKKNTDIYFSLLYKKLINSTPSKSFYFYHDMLWCNGSINDETNEMIGIDVSTRPKYGTRKYRNDYDSKISENLVNGNYQKIPKIVSIPIADITPASVIGEKSIKFKKEKYKLKKLNPKLIIYESINERRYSFDNLISLINSSDTSNVKLVLHFSWPYLRGVAAFLETIEENKDINVLHLGKRFCIESRTKFEKPSPDIIDLSLEGNLWDLYYPSDTSIDYRIILPSLNRIDNSLPTTDIIHWDWPLDTKVRFIREQLKVENVDQIERNIISFPPVLDSFISPSETKKRCNKNGTWMTLPIEDIFSIKTRENSRAVNTFCGLCSDLEKCRDVAYEFRKLFTTTTISKKTLFQAYLIEKINHLLDVTDSFNNESNSDISLLIANLHPYLATQSSFPESINYLINSIKNSSKTVKLPRLICQDNTIYIEVRSTGDVRFKEPIFENGIIQEPSIRKVKNIFANSYLDLDLAISNNDNKIDITVKTKDPIEYFDYDMWNNRANKKHFKNFTIYNALIQNDGSLREKRLSEISFDRRSNHSLIEVKVECRTEKLRFENTHTIQLLYGALSKIHELPQELIQSSELLIPGPIPFHTISDQEILISHGYDAFLLPFKKLIFFAYPGMNFRQLLKQINSYKDLISEKQTDVAKMDLSFSINHTTKNQRFYLPFEPGLSEYKGKVSNGDTPVDTVIREELMDTSKADVSEIDDIKTLNDIWNTIKQNKQSQKSLYSFEYQSSKEQIEFCVEYDTGERDTISFPVDKLIRKKAGDDYVLLSVDDLSEGDQIYYIQSNERESIENYLLKILLSEEEMSLEQILEPLTDLKIFYDCLNSLNFATKYSDIEMKKIYWLSPEQKNNLYNVLRCLLNKESLTDDEKLNLITDSIWNDVKPKRLIEIHSEGIKKVTKKKLYHLALEMGLTSYKETSFKALCTKTINEQKHYSFHNEKNLEAIGKLIGNSNIINNYQAINERGSMVGKFLRQVGFSIKRVASGNSEPFNEIDMAIGKKLKKCVIVKKGKC